MCTVTFLPDADRRGYLLAHNRDEEWSRGPERPPQLLRLADRRVVAPEDSDAGGTWIGLDDRGLALCILNGAPGRGAIALERSVSRGALVRELLADASAPAVEHHLREREARGDLPFQPFRLLAVAPTGITRFAWDGAAIAVEGLEGPCLEVSHGVAPEEAERRRRAEFERARAGLGAERREERRDALVRFHRGHGAAAPAGDAYSVCLHAPRARTVSLTVLDVRPERRRLHYVAGPPCASGPGSTHEI